MPKKEDDSFVQEACLGRVKVKKGKFKICYLVKWEGYDKVVDITCEPSHNVLVEKHEDPLLDQAEQSFQADLKKLLSDYMAQKHGKPKAAPKEEVASPTPTPNSQTVGAKRKLNGDSNEDSKRQMVGKTSAPSDDGAKEIVIEEDCVYYVKKNRQYVCIPSEAENKWMGLFMLVESAVINPGIVWTRNEDLFASGAAAEKQSQRPRLYGSVDGSSKTGGFGWFHHKKSGVSLDGLRLTEHPDIPRFEAGDTIGVVVNVPESTGYLVKNDKTMCKVVFSAKPGDGLQFALHLGIGDKVRLVQKPTSEMPKYATEDCFELVTSKLAEAAY